MNALRYVRQRRYWLIAWFVGATLLYVVSWPSRLYRLPHDEVPVGLSGEGAYLAMQKVKEKDPKADMHAPQERYSELLIRSASSGRLYRSIETGTSDFSPVRFANKGSHVVAQCDGEVVAWHVSSGRKSMPGTRGHLYAVCQGSDDSQWAAILLLDDSTTPAAAGADYTGVTFVEIATGQTVSTLGPMNLYKGPFFRPGVALDQHERRAITISRIGNDKAGDAAKVRYTLWDTGAGETIGEFEDSGEPDPFYESERLLPRAWTLAPDGKTLWVALGVYRPLNQESEGGIAYLHVWDLQTMRRQKRWVEESPGDVLAAIGNGHGLSFLSDSVLRVDTYAGNFILDTSGEALKCIAIDGGDNAVSSDGSLWAKEDGEIVDASPPFVYKKVNRRLSVVRTSDDAEVVSILGSSNEVTLQRQFVPVGFTADSRYLVYKQYRDTAWGDIRAKISDLVNLRMPRFEMRPIEVRCVDLDSGRSHLVGLPFRAVHLCQMMPGDRVKQGYEVWSVPGRKPWLVILLLPLLPLLVAHRWLNRSKQNGIGSLDATDPQGDP